MNDAEVFAFVALVFSAFVFGLWLGIVLARKP